MDREITWHLADPNPRGSVPPEVSRFQGTETVKRPQLPHMVNRETCGFKTPALTTQEELHLRPGSLPRTDKR
jgi:hypothetical protein